MTRQQFIEKWQAVPRRVPLEIALVTAELESSFREDATRYESEVHSRKGGTKSDWTSYGLFQILGQNLDRIGYGFIHRSNWGNDTVLDQMNAYDQFMGDLLAHNDVRTAFRKYNGSGSMAERYADRAMSKLNNAVGGRVVVAQSGTLLGLCLLTFGAWVGLRVIRGGK